MHRSTFHLKISNFFLFVPTLNSASSFQSRRVDGSFLVDFCCKFQTVGLKTSKNYCFFWCCLLRVLLDVYNWALYCYPTISLIALELSAYESKKKTLSEKKPKPESGLELLNYSNTEISPSAWQGFLTSYGDFNGGFSLSSFIKHCLKIDMTSKFQFSFQFQQYYSRSFWGTWLYIACLITFNWYITDCTFNLSSLTFGHDYWFFKHYSLWCIRSCFSRMDNSGGSS